VLQVCLPASTPATVPGFPPPEAILGSLRLAVSLLCLVAAACQASRRPRPDPRAEPSSPAPASHHASGQLEIHHVNVQQGDCTLIVGPDGTTFLIDAGNQGKGISEVVPYLQSLGIAPSGAPTYWSQRTATPTTTF
jgi:hypothetical protein